MLRSSLGATSRGVTPDEHSSRQKRLVGCAYACPLRAVWIPGLRPMKRMRRLGAIASGMPPRWA
jgi:hypothetical protein